ARIVADALGLELREVAVPLPAASDLARMVHHVEMPFKAQIEIAWPCWHLAERMAADGFKVVFSGEGSDELWASYGFTYHAMKRDAYRGLLPDSVTSRKKLAFQDGMGIKRAIAATVPDARAFYGDLYRKEYA